MEPQEQPQNTPLQPEPVQQNPETVTPKKGVTISTPMAIITAGFIIALALIFTGRGGIEMKNPTAKVPDLATTEPTSKVSLSPSDYVRGDLTKAKVVIVEYSDSDCPFCQRFHTTMKDVLKTYGTKVAWVYRYFPLSIHPDSSNEASALECVGQLAGNETFWSYLDQIMEITVSPESSKTILTNTATALGVDGKLFATCIANPATAKKVADQSKEAQSLGAQGTPYSIAIGKSGKQSVIAGALPIEQVKKIVDGLLK